MPETGSVDQIPRYDTTAPTQRTVTSELGKSDFLELLVAQLRNQDPLSPQQNEEFVAQLAQFSSLEQLTNINDTLSSGMGLSEQLAPLSTLTSINDLLENNQLYNMILAQSINNTMAAALIDRVVTWQADTVALGASGDVEMHYGLDQSARAVTARILDEQGRVVQVLSTGAAGAGEHKLVWDGKGGDGVRVPPGNYRIEIAAVSSTGESMTVTPYLKGRVDGVRYVDGMAYLDVDGMLVALADVQKLSAE